MVPTVPVITDPSRPSSERYSSSAVSHGRGGAGNMGPWANGMIETEQNIKIPVLKSLVYTTGRGGTGNMAVNNLEHPERARMAQGVEELPRVRDSGDFHGGRGGAGNFLNPDEVEAEAALAREEEEMQRLTEKHFEPVDHSKIDYRGWADRGKDKLFGRKKKDGK